MDRETIIENESNQTITTHKLIQSYHLLEIDWVCVADYLNNTKHLLLKILCSSSLESLYRINGVPWVHLLHGADVEIAKIVAEVSWYAEFTSDFTNI